MKKEEKKIYEETLKEINFYETFPEIIEKEKSNLGKLLLQENLIFSRIIFLLHAIRLFIELSVANEFDENKSLKEIKGISINIPDNKVLFKEFTLGRLIGLLKIFLNSKTKIISNLDIYNAKRNDLTHKIFLKYKSSNKIKTEAKELIKLGKKILKEIKLLDQDFTTNDRILAEQYFLDKKSKE